MLNRVMGNPLSDHKDTEHFLYDRSWSEIEDMLDRAERTMNHHHSKVLEYSAVGNRKKSLAHARNYKALQGVCKTLRWVLGDMSINHPLD